MGSQRRAESRDGGLQGLGTEVQRSGVSCQSDDLEAAEQSEKDATHHPNCEAPEM